MGRSRRTTVAVLAFALTSLPIPATAVSSQQSVIVSDDPVNWTPHVLDGRVNAIVQIGDQVIAGGRFTQVRRTGTQTIVNRTNLFAFSYATGAIDADFAPTPDGEVLALAVSPDGEVFAGGEFDSVNGVSRRKVVKLDSDTGQVITAFSANAGAKVKDLEVRGSRLFMAGTFKTVRNTPRTILAAVDATTGALDPNVNLTFADPLNDGVLTLEKIDLTADGSRLVAIGNFSHVNGLERTQAALVNLGGSATVANWQTDTFKDVCSPAFPTYMRDVEFSPDEDYFVIVTTGAYRANLICDTSSRWEMSATGTGIEPTWIDWTGGDTTFSVAVTGTAIYVGGHMRWQNNPYAPDSAGPGAVPREGIAALDPVNGLPFSWNPGRVRGVGVFDFTPTGDGLWVGSDTDRLGGEFHARIGFFPIAGGSTPPASTPYSLPNDLYNAETGGTMRRRSYNGTTFGTATTVPGVDWSSARGIFALNGRLYYGKSNGWMYRRSFDGTNFGPEQQINLHGLEVAPNATKFKIPGTTIGVPPFAGTSSTSQLPRITGMFFQNGRMYYTVEGNPRLYYRYFEPEDDVVGANLFVANANSAVYPWGDVRGMTLASGKLYFARSNGNLYRVDFVNGAPQGTPAQIGGPGMNPSYNWASRGMFVFGQTTDSNPPSKPGKPTGVSNTGSSIDLTWAASNDSVSDTLTYRVYRDGGSSPVGTVTSDSDATVSFRDTGLASGSTHTYRVDARDAAGNTSPLSDQSDPIQVLSPDTTPPSTPGKPSGVANGPSRIDLSWAASTDDRSTDIRYLVYRDGDTTTPVGDVTSSSTGSVGFTDTGLAGGSTHTYRVAAEDEEGNTSALSPASDPITTEGVIFSDDFGSGNFSNWTSVTRMTIDNSTGGAAPPSARAQVTGQSAFASKTLSSTFTDVCMSVAVNVANQGGTGLNLVRLRTASNGPIAKVYVNPRGILAIRADFSGSVTLSGTALPSGWNVVELCGTVGTSGTWDLYLNGTKIVNAWTVNTGTGGVGRVQIGDAAAKTFTMNVDDVVVDTAAG